MTTKRKDLMAQINELEISGMPDDISSMAPDSTLNNPYRSVNIYRMPESTASKTGA